MFSSKSIEQSNGIAEQAIRSTQNLANHALDDLSSTADDVRDRVAPLLNRASEQASALAQRGVNAVRDGSQQLRKSAQRASDNTVDYIKAEPMKSVLIAAATGAVLMALVGLLSRSRTRD